MLTAFEILPGPLFKSAMELRMRQTRTAASMMISFPPRKKAVFLGSNPFGISSKNKVLSAQSKCYPSALVISQTYPLNVIRDSDFTGDKVIQQ
jgi:hypothetical protein